VKEIGLKTTTCPQINTTLWEEAQLKNLHNAMLDIYIFRSVDSLVSLHLLQLSRSLLYAEHRCSRLTSPRLPWLRF